MDHQQELNMTMMDVQFHLLKLINNILGLVMKDNFEIKFEWNIKDHRNVERIGTMYCFKICEININ